MRFDYRYLVGLAAAAALIFVLTRGYAAPDPPSGARVGLDGEPAYEIVTLLPFDAIPAIDNPRFFSAGDADAEYTPDELVLGVTLNGESRAYSTAHLDRHEIVNDTVGGRPIAVTW